MCCESGFQGRISGSKIGAPPGRAIGAQRTPGLLQFESKVTFISQTPRRLSPVSSATVRTIAPGETDRRLRQGQCALCRQGRDPAESLWNHRRMQRRNFYLCPIQTVIMWIIAVSRRYGWVRTTLYIQLNTELIKIQCRVITNSIFQTLLGSILSSHSQSSSFRDEEILWGIK